MAHVHSHTGIWVVIIYLLRSSFQFAQLSISRVCPIDSKTQFYSKFYRNYSYLFRGLTFWGSIRIGLEQFIFHENICSSAVKSSLCPLIRNLGSIRRSRIAWQRFVSEQFWRNPKIMWKAALMSPFDQHSVTSSNRGTLKASQANIQFALGFRIISKLFGFFISRSDRRIVL